MDVEKTYTTEEAANYYDYTPETDPQVQRAVSAAQQLSGTSTLGGVIESAASSEAADSEAAGAVSASSEEAASSAAAEASSEAASSAE